VLDATIITGDPLHCQRKNASTIVEKVIDYLLQIKANQPKLFKHAQKLDGLEPPPFFQRPESATDASKTRAVHTVPIEPLEADLARARALIDVRSQRTVKKTGARSSESRYYLSSAPPFQHRPDQWLNFTCGHWAGLEIRYH